MASKRTCDNCGNPATGTVEASVAATGIVAPDVPTGVGQAADCCDECREDLVRKLFDKALAQLIRDAPRQREIHAAREEEIVAQGELRDVNREISIIEAGGRVPAGELADRRRKAQARADTARDRYEQTAREPGGA